MRSNNCQTHMHWAVGGRAEQFKGSMSAQAYGGMIRRSERKAGKK